MLNSVHEFMHILAGMVQSDCHNTQPLLNKITNRLDKEFVDKESVDSSAYSEVVNHFYVEENLSRGNLYY